MEAVAPELQQLSTILHSDPYWKSDMSKSWLKIEICFSLWFLKLKTSTCPIFERTHIFQLYTTDSEVSDSVWVTHQIEV